MTKQCNNLPSIEELTRIRTFLEQKWNDYNNMRVRRMRIIDETYQPEELPSSDYKMCTFTATFLKMVLGATWSIGGGYHDYYVEGIGWTDKPDGGGFFDGLKWNSHNWITNKTMIIDLTAVQFNDAPIIITNIYDPRYKDTLTSYERKDVFNSAKLVVTEWFNDWKTYNQLHVIDIPSV